MGEYQKEICLLACQLPADYVRHQSKLHGDEPYGPNDEVADVPVTVEYNEGWARSGNRSGHPDTWEDNSGEDPEVTSIAINDPDYDGDTNIDEILKQGKIYEELVFGAVEDQQNHNGW